MMKKLFALLLCLSMMLTCVNAMALNYQQHFDNEMTFETLEEARVSGPAYLAEATGRVYVADPALDTYPAGTTYVYRSAGIYSSLSAGPRMNTTILVYTDAAFASKEEAKAYLDNLGLDKIITEAYGSVVLVTPIDAQRGYGAADQYAFYQLQSAMCNINYSNRATGEYFADNAYYGGLTYRYVIGIGAGATFVNNFIASTYDYVTRIAGMLLVGGDMERIRDVASFVPVYLVNPSAMAVEKYKAANQVNACAYDGADETYFNQAQPLQRVTISGSSELTAELVDEVYHSFMIKAMRNAVVRSGLNNASTLYSSYNFNQAPYSLDRRNAIVNGKTADGLTVTEHHEDRFQDIHTDAGEYLDVWYEILPDEVLDGTAQPGTVPLVLCNHGSGDDPIQYLDETGWLNVAGDHRVALVAPYHQNIGTSFDPSIRYEALPALVEYMLAQYPALDATRVFATGYSMGGGATYATIYGKPELFAAVVPMAAMPRVSFATEEQAAKFDNLDMPIMITTSTCDLYVGAGERLIDDYEQIINMIRGFNGMAPIENLDFDAWKITGFKADHFKQIVVNNQYNNYTWLFDNQDGIPMVGVNITDFLPHGLYPEYAKVAWEFMSHYYRNQETKAVEYLPYVK